MAVSATPSDSKTVFKTNDSKKMVPQSTAFDLGAFEPVEVEHLDAKKSDLHKQI